MREPDLVQRAERAATALERAWVHWRARHGLGAGSPPPVSSYVGYSLEEPWGQPRVVFDVEASDAERLAAILEGHDCYGPVHAEMSGRSDWRQQPAAPAVLWPLPAEDRISYVPEPGTPLEEPAPAMAADLASPAADIPAAIQQAAATADLPPELPAAEAEHLRELAARSSGQPASSEDDDVPDDVAADLDLVAAPVDTSTERPVIVAVRPRSGSHDDDPVGEPAVAPVAAAEDESVAGDQEKASKPASSLRSRARPLPVSKLSRTRKQNGARSGAATRWPAADKAEQVASDSPR